MDWRELKAVWGGDVAGRPSLVMEFFGEESELAPHGEALLDRFLTFLPKGTPLYARGYSDSSVKKLTPLKLAKFRSKLQLRGEGRYMALKTLPEDKAGDFTFEMHLDEPYLPSMNSCIAFCLPPEWGDAPRAEETARIFESYVTDFPFWGAIAAFGFDIVDQLEAEQIAMPVNFKAAQRYHGLLIRNHFMSEQMLEEVEKDRPYRKRIPSVAWLTYLGAELLEEAGGLESVRSILGEEAIIGRQRGGALFRIAETPPLAEAGVSDPGRDGLARLHKAISKVVRKKYANNYDRLGVGERKANAWLRRFEL